MRPTPLRGPAWEAFVAPARPRARIWRLALGLFFAFATWAAAVVLVGMLRSFGGLEKGQEPLLAMLASFGGLSLGVILAARLLDRRGPRTLIGPRGFRPRAFAVGAGAALGYVAVLFLVGLFTGDHIFRAMEWRAWLAMLPFGLAAVAIQTSAEELLFRGYLLQGLGARFRSPVIWLGLPALLFGGMHWSADLHGANAGLFALTAAVIGLILGDVTARTGDLSAAMGIHFANNAAALLLVASDGPLGGLALFATATGPEDSAAYRASLLLGLAAMLAGYGLWLRWHGRGHR